MASRILAAEVASDIAELLQLDTACDAAVGDNADECPNAFVAMAAEENFGAVIENVAGKVDVNADFGASFVVQAT